MTRRRGGCGLLVFDMAVAGRLRGPAADRWVRCAGRSACTMVMDGRHNPNSARHRRSPGGTRIATVATPPPLLWPPVVLGSVGTRKHGHTPVSRFSQELRRLNRLPCAHFPAARVSLKRPSQRSCHPGGPGCTSEPVNPVPKPLLTCNLRDERRRDLLPPQEYPQRGLRFHERESPLTWEPPYGIEP